MEFRYGRYGPTEVQQSLYDRGLISLNPANQAAVGYKGNSGDMAGGIDYVNA
jgi:hypothetical protein